MRHTFRRTVRSVLVFHAFIAALAAARAAEADGFRRAEWSAAAVSPSGSGDTCDLGVIFGESSAWKVPSDDFLAAHGSRGFVYASEKRDIVNNLKRGTTTWRGLEVWESRIYYSASGVERVEMSLYNRGDDDDTPGLEAKMLEELLASVASRAQPNGKAKLAPARKELPSGGYQLTQKWTKGPNEVDLAWGVNSLKKDQRAQYVRVTLRPKGTASASGAKTKRQLRGPAFAKAVKSHVRKNAEGDVWIDGVPMVDQGQKGYCAAATSERVLRYYGFEIDEHEIAQTAGTTAKGGTSISEMREAVRAVGSKCHLGYSSVVAMMGGMDDVKKSLEFYNKAAKAAGEPVLEMNSFMRGNTLMVGPLSAAQKPSVLKDARKRDPRFKKFLKDVKMQVDQGIPLFWGVTLGLFPEPDIPQANGGHIRLIIGYNAKTKEILYSDSWGQRHELKRMPEDQAFAITHDVFFLKPL